MSLPTPYYNEDGITIYHGDCREILPDLEPVDLVLADPPYGMNYNADSTRFSGGIHPDCTRETQPRVVGDDAPFDPSPWLSYPRVILWGLNHFAQRLPPGTALVWIKRTDNLFGSFMSDADLAWMKGGHGVYCFRETRPAHWDDSVPRGSVRLHPTQKPLSLMQWCLKKAGGDGTVLDPFLGSGTTLVACKLHNRRGIGIEIEEEYCEKAARRLAQGVFDFGEKNGECRLEACATADGGS